MTEEQYREIEIRYQERIDQAIEDRDAVTLLITVEKMRDEVRVILEAE
jgi:hypothetical protein